MRISDWSSDVCSSDLFAKGRRYGFFPSISAGWNIQNEAFFENYRSTIDLLKIRGSYGSVGGDQLGSRRFLYLEDRKRVVKGKRVSVGVDLGGRRRIKKKKKGRNSKTQSK